MLIQIKSRRADAVLFGFDFQVNAAIVLMLENIKDLRSLRLEGNYEDIELALNDDRHILAQAKSVVNSSSDFSNVRQNLKKALETLSEGCEKVNTKELILITNSPNPINDDESKRIFWGPATCRHFSTLPLTSQQIITEYLKEIDQPLGLDKFIIQTLPFETDDDTERYKVIMQRIDEFVGDLSINVPGLGKKLLDTWHVDVFHNGSKKDASIRLTKKDVIWPIMVITTAIERCDDDFMNQFDPSLYDEIVRHYKETIDSHCERIEFFTKVLSDFNGYSGSKVPSEKCLDFVENSWRNYCSEFDISSIDDETQEALTKVIIYNITRRRISIDKIKNGVNL